MSIDPNSAAAASPMSAGHGPDFSNEASLAPTDSSDGWVGYESAFPFPMDDLAGAVLG